MFFFGELVVGYRPVLGTLVAYPGAVAIRCSGGCLARVASQASIDAYGTTRATHQHYPLSPPANH